MLIHNRRMFPLFKRRKISGKYEHFRNQEPSGVIEFFEITQQKNGALVKAELRRTDDNPIGAELIFLHSWQGTPIGGELLSKRGNNLAGSMFLCGLNKIEYWLGKKSDPHLFPVDAPYVLTSTFLSIRNHFVLALETEPGSKMVRPTIWLSTGSAGIPAGIPVRLDGSLEKMNETRLGNVTKTEEQKYVIKVFTQAPFPARYHEFWFSNELGIISQWTFDDQKGKVTYELSSLRISPPKFDIFS